MASPGAGPSSATEGLAMWTEGEGRGSEPGCEAGQSPTCPACGFRFPRLASGRGLYHPHGQEQWRLTLLSPAVCSACARLPGQERETHSPWFPAKLVYREGHGAQLQGAPPHRDGAGPARRPRCEAEGCPLTCTRGVNSPEVTGAGIHSNIFQETQSLTHTQVLTLLYSRLRGQHCRGPCDPTPAGATPESLELLGGETGDPDVGISCLPKALAPSPGVYP